jgi:hypothetical protein
MATARLMLATASFTPRARGGAATSVDEIRALEERLAGVERELRLQFTRIAQLQAELDLSLGALRRLTGATDRGTRRR